MTDLQLLARGRDADVFALGATRVLRRYRDGSDVAAEAEVMRFVESHGFPVPALYDAAGPDMVLERLAGPTMLSALEAGTMGVAGAAQVLAELHVRLGRLPPRSGRSPDERVLHLDLHPENVILGGQGPVVIDWRNATDGSRDVDVAMSALILAQVAADDSDARAPDLRIMLREFLGLMGEDALRGLPDVVARRAADRNVTGAERALLPRAEALVRDLCLRR